MAIKFATTIDDQIALLKQRGMMIDDEQKAKEVLLDVGYYRLGFYWFPFEQSYPRLTHRSHGFVQGACFKEAVDLYYLDTEIRNLLAPYLYRIEVNLRTFLIYTVSNGLMHVVSMECECEEFLIRDSRLSIRDS